MYLNSYIHDVISSEFTNVTKLQEMIDTLSPFMALHTHSYRNLFNSISYKSYKRDEINEQTRRQ